MSQHHKRQKWSTHSPKLRRLLEPMLPMPCARCGRPVVPGSDWHVGHRVSAEDNGTPDITNVRPEHAACSHRSGGQRAAQITNTRRRRRSNSSKGIREW